MISTGHATHVEPELVPVSSTATTTAGAEIKKSKLKM
jgi:hypothetical protein